VLYKAVCCSLPAALVASHITMGQPHPKHLLLLLLLLLPPF
jgi:hypothetical protein